MDRKALSLCAGVWLTSASALLFELALTRIFSVTLWYHFAYLAVSLALFGLGAGGLSAFFAREWLDRRFPRVLGRLACLQAIAILVCLGLVLDVRIVNWLSPRGLLGLVRIFTACAVPFFLVGVCLALVLRRRAEDAPRLYCADLLGSGSACILFVPAIWLMSGPGVVLAAAVLALLAGVCFAERVTARRLALQTTGVGAVALALWVVSTHTPLFRVKYTKSYEEKSSLLFEKWSPLARITVYPAVLFESERDTPFGWGLSAKFKPKKPVRQIWVEQDACAGTPITEFLGNPAELEHLRYDVTSFAYHIHPRATSAFIIGCGGGRDVLAALAFGVPEVRACDINPVIVDLVRNRYRDFAGNLYGRPGVHVEVAEGRSCLRRQDHRFDIIQISLIDSWAATTAGAFSLAENNLYTVEAYADYLARLTDDGLLSVTRYLFTPRNQSLRNAVLARSALAATGVDRPENHIIVIATSQREGVATVLARKRAFTADDGERITQAARDLGFEVLYTPGHGANDPDFQQALAAESSRAYRAASEYDLSPPTDNRPFFFQMLRFSHAFDLVLRPSAVHGQTFNYVAPLVLIVLLAISGVLVGLFYVVPLVCTRTIRTLPVLWGVYFILLGVGFMFVEIFLLQKGALYLEHPTFSLTAVLFAMLTAAGLGSLWSRRISDAVLPAKLARLMRWTVVLIAGLGIAAEVLTRYTLALPLAWKIPLFVMVVAIAAFWMGTLFPSGIRLVSRAHVDSIPWVWALNGGASVMGSILAMAVAMMFGYVQTLALGWAFYVLALLVTSRLVMDRADGPLNGPRGRAMLTDDPQLSALSRR